VTDCNSRRVRIHVFRYINISPPVQPVRESFNVLRIEAVRSYSRPLPALFTFNERVPDYGVVTVINVTDESRRYEKFAFQSYIFDWNAKNLFAIS